MLTFSKHSRPHTETFFREKKHTISTEWETEKKLKKSTTAVLNKWNVNYGCDVAKVGGKKSISIKKIIEMKKKKKKLLKRKRKKPQATLPHTHRQKKRRRENQRAERKNLLCFSSLICYFLCCLSRWSKAKSGTSWRSKCTYFSFWLL